MKAGKKAAQWGKGEPENKLWIFLWETEQSICVLPHTKAVIHRKSVWCAVNRGKVALWNDDRPHGAVTKKWMIWWTGQETTHHFAVTEVYIRQDDSWKLIQFSFTALVYWEAWKNRKGFSLWKNGLHWYLMLWWCQDLQLVAAGRARAVIHPPGMKRKSMKRKRRKQQSHPSRYLFRHCFAICTRKVEWNLGRRMVWRLRIKYVII